MSTAAAATAAAPVQPIRRRRKLVVVGLSVLALCAALAAAFVMVVQRHWQASQALETEAEADVDGPDGANRDASRNARVDLNSTPVYVSLEPFTVNLADRDAERMAQVGVTLEITDIKVAEQIKDYMPAVRNHVLMAIADRNAAELLGRDGKARLAKKIIYEVSRTLGYEATNPDAAEHPEPNAAQRGSSGPASATAATTAPGLAPPAQPTTQATERLASAAPAAALPGANNQNQNHAPAPVLAQIQPRRKPRGAGAQAVASPIKAVHFSAFIVQ
jgi:flagellar protein FliL